jgi:hypothetical protein
VHILENEKKSLINEKIIRKNPNHIENSKISKDFEEENFKFVAKKKLKLKRKQYSLSFKYKAILEYEEKQNYYEVSKDLGFFFFNNKILCVF